LDLRLDGLELSHVPIFYQLFKTDIYLKASTNLSLSRQSEKIGSSYYTVVTPGVYAFSMVLFSQCFKVIKPYKQVLSRPYKHPLNMEETHGAFPAIKWIGSPSEFFVYDAVRIGKTIYKVWYFFFLCFTFYINLYSQEKL
jgi:hypothetical protein